MKRLLAGLGLLGIATGVPATLLATTGGPGRSPGGAFGGLDSTYLPLEPVLGALALAAWLLWAYVLVAIVLRALAVVVARRTGRTTLVRASDRLTPRPLRRWVDFAIGGALLASSFSVGRALAVPAAQVTVAVSAPARHADHVLSQREFKTYVVRPGDSLWAIAERELGSGFRWNEIYRENKGRRFSDGRCLENPRLIHPGWDLYLRSVNGTHRIQHAQADPVQPTSAPSRAERGAPEVSIETPPSRIVQPPAQSAADEEHAPASDEVEEARGPEPEPVLRLHSGAVIASSFACGVLSAELLTRLRRRRARRLLTDDAEIDMPEQLVRDLRHAGATPTSTPLDVALDEVIAVWRAHTGIVPRVLAVVEERRRIQVVLDEPADRQLPKPAGGRITPEVRFERTGSTVTAVVRGPFPQRLRRISTASQRGLLVPLGHVGKTTVHIAPLGVGVTAITGEEADEVVHQLLLAQATEAGPDDLRITLLGSVGQGLESLPHVTATDWDDASDALQEVQAEFIRRARLFQREGVEDAREHSARHSDELLAALVIVAADPPPSMRGVLDAVAQEVARYGGTLIAAGWRPPPTTLHVIAGAGALRIETQLPIPARLSSFLLDDATARDIQEVVARASIQDDETPTEDPPRAADDHEVILTQFPVRDSSEHVEPVRLALPSKADTPAVAPPPGMPAVRCLGSFQITRDGTARAKGWRSKSRELLAYLVAHPDGATKERIMDELWPGEEPERLQAIFEKAVSVIRTQVRGKDDPRTYILKADDRWRLESGSWWIDAFEFMRLVEEAERSTDQADAVLKLRLAIALYRDNFCADLAYPWAEPVRERYRSTFTRACARAAEALTQAGQMDEALAILDKAIEIDPLCEDLWRRAMTIESQMGRPAAAADRFERLRGLLSSELDVEPDAETQRIAIRVTPRSSAAR